MWTGPAKGIFTGPQGILLTYANDLAYSLTLHARKITNFYRRLLKVSDLRISNVIFLHFAEKNRFRDTLKQSLKVHFLGYLFIFIYLTLFI